MNEISLLAYLPLITQGLITTVISSLGSLLFGLFLSLTGLLFLITIPLHFKKIYLFAIRFLKLVPELLLITLIYYSCLGLGEKFGIALHQIPALPIGILALAINFSLYGQEIFLSQYHSLNHDLKKTGHSFAMTPIHIFCRLEFPLLLKNSLSGLDNLSAILLKDTSLLSIIGVLELMKATKAAGIATGRELTILGLAAFLYFLLSLIWVWGWKKLARKLARTYGS